MDTYVIKILPEVYPEDNDIKNLLYYISGHGKHEEKQSVCYQASKGLNQSCVKAYKQILIMQEKVGKSHGMRMYHMIVSFPEKIKSGETIIKIADGIASMIFEDYQVFYAVHDATENIHIHFAINAVSYRNGRKWHKNPKEMEDLKLRIRAIIARCFDDI